MKDIDPSKPVREVALRDRRIRVALEQLGIDVCCGGRRPLIEAARAAGIALDTVQEAIASALRTQPATASARRDWTVASLAELTDHIESTHHAFLRTVLPRIADRLGKVIKAHGQAHGSVLHEVKSTFDGLRTEIEAHLMKEEQILFPYLREMSAALEKGKELPPMHCGSVSNPIRQMEDEHDHAGAALSAMRACTSGYKLPADACPTFAALYEDLKALEADLHEHVFLENNILYPRAEEAEQSARKN